MEADKEKHIPEKSSSFSKPTNVNDNDNIEDTNKDQNQNQDKIEVSNEITKESTKDQVTNDPPPSEQLLTAVDVVEATTDNAVNADKIDMEENKDGDSTEAQTIEEDITPTVPDLGKVSEEIDQFISDLSSLKKGDDNQQEPPQIGDFVEQFAVLVDSKIADYESSSTKLSQLTNEDSSLFLESVTRVSNLLASLSKFSSDSHYASAINRSGAILQHAMSFLEDEFKSILEDYQNPDLDKSQDQSKTKQDEEAAEAGTEQSEMQEELDQPKTEHQDESLGYSEEMITQLRKLAKALISGGHDTDCYQLYFFTRRKAVEDRLQKLGFEKFSIDDVQKMQWDSLEREILTWINTFKFSSSVLLANERRLSEAVFSHHLLEYASISESLSRGVVFQLLNFAEAITMTKRSAEKLFKFLDIYENLRDLIPTMDKLFPPMGLDELKTEASLTRCRLGEAMIIIFGELENSIKADTGKTPVPGGAVHPLTRYTMNYLKYACEYTETLEQVFREHQKIDRSDSTLSSDFDINGQDQSNHSQNLAAVKQSPFQVQLMKVMDLLDVNLEAKSKLYKDNSLSLIFMMNNGRYILQKAKGAEGINSLMGDPWVRKRSSDLRSYHTNYKRETWGRLLNCLNHEGLNVNGKVVKPVLKERFKSFNAMFDEIHRNQSTWVVSDEQLQSELRVSISAIVIPAYRSFMGRFSQVLTPGRQTEKYIKYQPEDIETLVDELFDGNAAAAQGKKRGL